MARCEALRALLGVCVAPVLTEGAVEMLGAAERLGVLDTRGSSEARTLLGDDAGSAGDERVHRPLHGGPA